ncbi:MAG: phosphoribosylaminoimidazolesuccinocarboxamide synthase [Oscillospiraceae bacterium]|nr:phosphoribosylaminoimidazolesuccinocarboxamide synthase [Oscillospiraceae bacterium]
MKLVYDGKTKIVYELSDGNYLLKFKDDACGKDGVFDPGENQVGLTIEGKGVAVLKLSDFFFRKINEAGFPTHFVDCDVSKAEMTVRPATVFGKGIEVVCRYKAGGSFIGRYGDYIKAGETLFPPIVEITLKDDERGDPPITHHTLVLLGILRESEYDVLVNLVREISDVLKSECSQKGLDLLDLKLEFGRDREGKIMLIDEVSGDVMRVADKDGNLIEPLKLTEILIG